MKGIKNDNINRYPVNRVLDNENFDDRLETRIKYYDTKNNR